MGEACVGRVYSVCAGGGEVFITTIRLFLKPLQWRYESYTRERTVVNKCICELIDRRSCSGVKNSTMQCGDTLGMGHACSRDSGSEICK